MPVSLPEFKGWIGNPLREQGSSTASKGALTRGTHTDRWVPDVKQSTTKYDLVGLALNFSITCERLNKLGKLLKKRISYRYSAGIAHYHLFEGANRVSRNGLH